MSDKRQFVDVISERTSQNRRTTVSKSVVAAEPAEEKRLSNWPPERMQQWRLNNLTPWKMKLKSWKFKDWT